MAQLATLHLSASCELKPCPPPHTHTPSCISQVGLLLSDTAGNIVTVRKSFSITPETAAGGGNNSGGGGSGRGSGSGSDSGGGLVLESGSAGISSSGGGSNTAPVVRAGLSYATTPGGSFSVATGVADAEGDVVAIKWVLMQEATGATRSGSGPLVTVPAGSPPGGYRLLVTAADPLGATGEGTARVDVRAAALNPVPAALLTGSSTLPLPIGGWPAPPAPGPRAPLPPARDRQPLPPPSIYGAPLAAAPRLPARTLQQGAVLELDAAASGLFDLSRASWRGDIAAAHCLWTLEPAAAAAGSGGARSSGGSGSGSSSGTARVYGCGSPARFKLAAPGPYVVTLQVAARAGGAAANTSAAITVLARPYWSQFYTAATPQAFPAGRCAPSQLAGSEFRRVTLACSGVSLPRGWGADQGLDGVQQALAFAWRLTPLSAGAAAAHPAPLVHSSAAGVGRSGGGAADFGALAPGLYAAEVVGALASGSGARGSTADPAAVYCLWGLLVVEPNSQLPVTGAPVAPTCAGSSVTLRAPPPALLPRQAAMPPAWSVAWLDARAAVGRELALGGSGAAFSFTPQPGRYAVNASVDVTTAGAAGVRRLAAQLTLDARPCLACVATNVTLHTSVGACAPAAADAAKLLAARPAWLATAPPAFAPGSDLRPGGPRRLAVVARAALTPGLAGNCSVDAVTIIDSAPPTLALRRAGGECVAPASGGWACWASAAALAVASDNCASLHPVTVVAACDPTAAPSACRVLPDGRVCVRATPPGGAGAAAVAAAAAAAEGAARGSVSAAATSWPGPALLVRASDGFGNAAAQPLRVPITAHRAAMIGCVAPSLASLPP